MNIGEGCKKIVELVKEKEITGGITKNEVCEILRKKHGGSRSTYWKCFDQLLSPNSNDEIELRVVPPNKQLEQLFPTDKNKKVDEFRKEFDKAVQLIDLVEKNPLIGDCYDYPENDKELQAVMDVEVEVIRKYTDEEISFYTLKARHDILEKISLFLINYINDKNNKFSECAKKESMEIITPLMIRSVSILQNNYSESVYCSDNFYNKGKNTKHIYLANIEPESDIAVEFLKILGRYYFLNRKKSSDEFKMNSTKNQIIISEFTKVFYSKIDSKEDSHDNENIHDDALGIYFTETRPYNENLDAKSLKILNRTITSLAGKIMKKYLLYKESDPIKIHEFYIEWFLRLEIFNDLEKRILSLLTYWRRMDFEGYQEWD